MVPTIAFVAGQLSGGGAERQLLYLLRGLAASPVRVTLATLNPGDPGEAAVTALGIPVHRIPPSRWKIDRIARLAAWLRRERPVLVHSWVFSGNAYAAWAGALAGVPVRLGSLRGDALYENTVQWKAPPWFLRLGLEAPHAVVVNSAAAAAALAAHGRWRTQTRVVPNGIDVLALRQAASIVGPGGHFLPVGGRPNSPKGDGDSTTDPGVERLIVALVGNLIQRKNAPMFLRVIAGLVGRHPGIEGWLIGDGPERAGLETLAEEMGLAGRVRFWGRRADVAALLARAHILCHCSHSEGLANAIMEASGLGLPVVATRSGGTAELVESGITGFLVDTDDDAAMASSVDRLLADSELRTCLGEAGRRKIERDFSLEQMVRGMLEVYQEMLEKSPVGGILRAEC